MCLYKCLQRDKMSLSFAAWYANHGFSNNEDSYLDLNVDEWAFDDPHDPSGDGYNDRLAYYADDGLTMIMTMVFMAMAMTRLVTKAMLGSMTMTISGLMTMAMVGVAIKVGLETSYEPAIYPNAHYAPFCLPQIGRG